MTKITIELEDGTIREINATSIAMVAINSETDELYPIQVIHDRGDIVGFLTGAVKTQFLQLCAELEGCLAPGVTMEAVMQETDALSNRLLEAWNCAE